MTLGLISKSYTQETKKAKKEIRK